MKKIYYLSTCDTCKRIIKELNITDDSFVMQDIKKEPITDKQLEEIYTLVGNYHSLINKRAQLYKEYQLKDKILTEEQYKFLLLEHYTFLARPVIIIDNQVFVGNSKANIEQLKMKMAVN